jgi:hypothetical protein
MNPGRLCYLGRLLATVPPKTTRTGGLGRLFYIYDYKLYLMRDTMFINMFINMFTNEEGMYPDENELKAKQLLRFYFRRLYKSAGMEWDNDSAKDIDSIIPSILDALDERIALSVARAIVAPALAPTRVMIGNVLFDISGVTMARWDDRALKICIDGQTMTLKDNDAVQVWELLRPTAIHIKQSEYAR